MSTLQHIILCTARAWVQEGILRGWREGSKGNREAWIQQLWTCYGNAGQLGNAYCVPTAYCLITDAFTVAGGTNPLPKDNATLGRGHGNVYATLVDAIGRMPVDQEPAIGAVFARGNFNSGFNHMGVVLGVNVTVDGKQYALHTVEGNTSADGSTLAEGFVERLYPKELYDRYATVPIKEHQNLSAGAFTGWYFMHVEAVGPVGVVSSGTSACWGFDIVCHAPEENVATCDVTRPPAPGDDASLWGEWLLISDVEEAYLRSQDDRPEGAAVYYTNWTRPPRGEDPPPWQVDPTQCWLRFRKDPVTGTVDRPETTLPPERRECVQKVIKTPCRPGTGVTIRYPSGSEVVTLAELGSRPIRESMFAQSIERDGFMNRWSSEARAKQQFDTFPVISTTGGLPIVTAIQSSGLYRVMEQQSLLGPAPAVLRINREQAYMVRFEQPLRGPVSEIVTNATFLQPGQTVQTADGNRGMVEARLVGGGWAERAAWLYDPSGVYGMVDFGQRFSDGTGIVNGMQYRYAAVSVWEWLKQVERAEGELHERFKVAVVQIDGEPTIAWSQIEIAVRVLTSVIPVPGLASVVSGILSVVNPIINRGGTLTFDDIFNIAAAFVTAVKSTGGDKPLGVDRSIWNDIESTILPSKRIALAMDQGIGPGVQQLASEIGAGNLQGLENLANRTSIGREAFNAMYCMRRGLEAEIRKAAGWVTDVGKTVTTTYNSMLADVQARAADLIRFSGDGITSELTKILSSVSDVRTATLSPLVQDMFGATPDTGILSAFPGSHQIASAILRTPSFHANDITDPLVYQAMAALGSGRAILDRSLESFQLSALLRKAEDMARNGIHFTVPPVLGEDRVECITQEISVCVGCPPGYKTYNFRCIPDGTGTRTTSSGGGSIDIDVESSGGGGTTTTDKPTVTLPSCIIEQDDKFWYCPPASCALTPPPTTTEEPWVEQIVQLYREGTMYEIRARRRGTGEWQDYAMRPMIPDGNGWRPNITTFAPVNATDILPTFSSELFNQLLFDQLSYQAMVAQGTTSAPTTAPTSGPIAPPSLGPVGGLCLTRYEARVALDPFPRWFANVAGTWTEIFDCCPKTDAIDACCDKLMAEIGKVYLALQRPQPQLDLAPLMMALEAMKADLFVAIQNVDRGGPGITYDDSRIIDGLNQLWVKLNEPRPEPPACPTCPPNTPFDDAPLRALIQQVLYMVQSQRPCDTQTLERKIDDNRNYLIQLIQRPQTTYDDTPTQNKLFEITQMLLELLRRAPVTVTNTGTPTIDYNYFNQRFDELRQALPQCPTLQQNPAFAQAFAQLQASIDAITQQLPLLRYNDAELREEIDGLRRAIETRVEAPTCDVSELTRITTRTMTLVETLLATHPPAAVTTTTTTPTTTTPVTSITPPVTSTSSPGTSSTVTCPAYDDAWLRETLTMIQRAVERTDPIITDPVIVERLDRLTRAVDERLVAMIVALQQKVDENSIDLKRLLERPVATPSTPAVPYDDTFIRTRLQEQTDLLVRLLDRACPDCVLNTTSTPTTTTPPPTSSVQPVGASIDYNYFTEKFNEIIAALPQCPSCPQSASYADAFAELHARIDAIPQYDDTEVRRAIERNREYLIELLQRPQAPGYNDTELLRRIDMQTALLIQLVNRPTSTATNSNFDYDFIRQRFDELRQALPQCPTLQQIPDFARAFAELHARIDAITIPVYDDTAMRREIERLRITIESRTQDPFCDTEELRQLITRQTQMIEELLRRANPAPICPSCPPPAPYDDSWLREQVLVIRRAVERSQEAPVLPETDPNIINRIDAWGRLITSRQSELMEKLDKVVDRRSTPSVDLTQTIDNPPVRTADTVTTLPVTPETPVLSRPAERPQQDPNCPDCPVMVEEQKRTFYRYPPPKPAPRPRKRCSFC